jgi:hypothetical protein
VTRARWKKALLFALALLAAPFPGGIILIGCAYRELTRRDLSHIGRDAGAAAARYPEDPELGRVVTMTAALQALHGPPSDPVTPDHFEADLARTRDAAGTWGAVREFAHDAAVGLGATLMALGAGGLAVLAGPAVARRAGSLAAGGARWLLSRSGIGEELAGAALTAAADAVKDEVKPLPSPASAPLTDTAAAASAPAAERTS